MLRYLIKSLCPANAGFFPIVLSSDLPMTTRRRIHVEYQEYMQGITPGPTVTRTFNMNGKGAAEAEDFAWNHGGTVKYPPVCPW